MKKKRKISSTRNNEEYDPEDDEEEEESSNSETEQTSFHEAFDKWFFELTKTENIHYERSELASKLTSLYYKDINSFAKENLKEFHKSRWRVKNKSKEELINLIVDEYLGFENVNEKRRMEMENLDELDWMEVNVSLCGVMIPKEILEIVISYMGLVRSTLNGLGSTNMNFYCLVNRIFGEKKTIFFCSENVKKIPLIVVRNVRVLAIGKKIVKKEVNYLMDEVDIDNILEVDLGDAIRLKKFIGIMRDGNRVFKNALKLTFPFFLNAKHLRIICGKLGKLSSIFPNLREVSMESPFLVDFSDLRIEKFGLGMDNSVIVKTMINKQPDEDEYDCKINFSSIHTLELFDITIIEKSKIFYIKNPSNRLIIKQNKKDLLDDVLEKFDCVKDIIFSRFTIENNEKLLDLFFAHFRNKKFDEFSLKFQYFEDFNNELTNFECKNIDVLATNVLKKLIFSGFTFEVVNNLLSKFDKQELLEEKEIIIHVGVDDSVEKNLHFNNGIIEETNNVNDICRNILSFFKFEKMPKYVKFIFYGVFFHQVVNKGEVFWYQFEMIPSFYVDEDLHSRINVNFNFILKNSRITQERLYSRNLKDVPFLEVISNQNLFSHLKSVFFKFEIDENQKEHVTCISEFIEELKNSWRKSRIVSEKNKQKKETIKTYKEKESFECL